MHVLICARSFKLYFIYLMDLKFAIDKKLRSEGMKIVAQITKKYVPPNQ